MARVGQQQGFFGRIGRSCTAESIETPSSYDDGIFNMHSGQDIDLIRSTSSEKYTTLFIVIIGSCLAYLWLIVISPMAASVFKPGLFSVVYITAPSQEVAKKLARGLVEKELAACVNIIPSITSIYKWEGKIEEDSELLLMVKTRTQRIEELTTFVKANHPYSVPEVISTPIENGHDLYLKFLNDNVPEKS